MRNEHDSLGVKAIPDSVYWGVQTARAIENFTISGVPISHYHDFIKALAMVKKAAATANHKLGRLAAEKAKAIIAAADEIIAGELADQFPVDRMQGGAGTSSNMNMNEVIANRGLELMGHQRGEYEFLHPNDDVNMAQSTNDAYPTAVRLAVILSHSRLTDALKLLVDAFQKKASEFASVVKLGRTEMQDAVPMTLGQEFGAFASTVQSDVKFLEDTCKYLHEVNLGGTAIGTKINSDPAYGGIAIEELAKISGFPLKQSGNLFEASWDMGALVSVSGALKRIAVKLGKISGDLRILSSGPRGGFGEISLPALQPGSSIMPGKVNPVMPEVLGIVCYQVIGHDFAITMAAEAGQLQLNAFEPLIAQNILDSLHILTNVIHLFTDRCVLGIEARADNCRRNLDVSTATVTALSRYIGYEKASKLAKEALATGRTVRDLAAELLPDVDVDDILDPMKLVG